MSNLQAWVPALQILVVSVILPFVIAYFKRCEWSTDVKRWFSYGLSALVAVLVALAAWPLEPETLIPTVLGCVGGVQIVHIAFKSIGITSNLLEALDEVGGSNED